MCLFYNLTQICNLISYFSIFNPATLYSLCCFLLVYNYYFWAFYNKLIALKSISFSN